MSGSSKFFFIVSGIVSIILGIFLLLNPVINLMAFAWLFSIIFFVSAVSSIINYFMLQQYVSELISSEFLEYKTQDDDKEIIVLTEKGDKVLFFFKDRISPNKLKLIDEYVRKHVEKIKKELSISADYTVGEDSSFIVNLKAD